MRSRSGVTGRRGAVLLVLLVAMTSGATSACGQAAPDAQTEAPPTLTQPPASVGIGSPLPTSVPAGPSGAGGAYGSPDQEGGGQVGAGQQGAGQVGGGQEGAGQVGAGQEGAGQEGADQQGANGTGEQAASSNDGGFGWLTVLLVMVVALAAGVIVGRALRPAGRVPARVTAAVGPGPSPAYEKAGRDRDELIETCIAVRDVVPVEALREQLGEALRRAGVEEVVADGEPFDPRVHRAVQGEPAPDVRRDGTVASTDRVGYRDGDRLVRPPEVVVYRADASRPAGSTDAPA